MIKHTRFFVKTPEEEARAKSEAGGGDEKGVAAEIGYVKFHTENKGALEMSELPRKQMEFSPHRNEPDVRVKPKEGKESPQVSDLKVPLHTEEGNGNNGFEVIPSPQSSEDNKEHK